MTQLGLMEWRPLRGQPTVEDEARLDRLQDRVRAYMSDGHWATLSEIASATGGSEAGCSARLRELRRVEGRTVESRKRDPGGGLYEYRVLP